MEKILELKDLSVGYGDIDIVREVTFSVNRGEIMGIVGESGCGKSTLLNTILQLGGSGLNVKKGSITYEDINLLDLSKEEWRTLRGKKIGVIFQDPGSSLNPLIKIGKQFIETMQCHEKIGKTEAQEKIIKIFEALNLDQGKRILNSYPYELSGGMNQRVAVALAMILNPSVIIADEPTSALDVTVQVQVVESLMKLRENFGTTIIIVTHNMGVVAKMADKVGVMYHGAMVEYGETTKVLSHPHHPYTKALLNAIPKLHGCMPESLAGRAPAFLPNEIGCAFRDRCSYACDTCETYQYHLDEVEKGHMSCCNKAV